jgi:hypothetical protein
MGGTQECVPRNYGMGALSRSLLQLSPWIVGKAAVVVADKSTLTTPPPPKDYTRTTNKRGALPCYCCCCCCCCCAVALLLQEPQCIPDRIVTAVSPVGAVHCLA